MGYVLSIVQIVIGVMIMISGRTVAIVSNTSIIVGILVIITSLSPFFICLAIASVVDSLDRQAEAQETMVEVQRNIAKSLDDMNKTKAKNFNSND